MRNIFTTEAQGAKSTAVGASRQVGIRGAALRALRIPPVKARLRLKEKAKKRIYLSQSPQGTQRVLCFPFAGEIPAKGTPQALQATFTPLKRVRILTMVKIVRNVGF